MNIAGTVSLVACMVGLVAAAMTFVVSSSPGMRSLRAFALSCTLGALYAASTATLASGSPTLARLGVKSTVVLGALHVLSWFAYTVMRDERKLTKLERGVVAGAAIFAVLGFFPDLFFELDEPWVHEVPWLGVRYIDARGKPLDGAAFAYFLLAFVVLLTRAIARLRSPISTSRAEVFGLSALIVTGLNDGLVSMGVTQMPYLLDLGFLSLVVSVGISLARRFVENAAALQRAQQELVQRERLAALGELSAIVAHEVRNPVGVILNATSCLRKMPDERERLLAILEEEGRRLEYMVSDLLDFARPSKLSLETISVDSIVVGASEAVRQAAPFDEAELVVKLEAGLPSIECDARLVRQALINLITNAIDAPGRRGPVELSAKLSPEGHLRLTVSDDGDGVTAESAAKVFEPFFTTRSRGTGLGLAIVRRIVEAHGGTISHRSREGGGATFQIDLRAPHASPPRKS